MKYICLFFLSILAFGQESDTINLNEVSLIDYSKFKQFRPKYKSITPMMVNFRKDRADLIFFSNFQIPKQEQVEIVAIEFLFESKRGKKNVCSEEFYFSPKIVNELNLNDNFIDDKWFTVEKGYNGKYIFPVNIIIKQKEINDYLLGIQLSNINSDCKGFNTFIDMLNLKEKSYFYLHPSNSSTAFIKSDIYSQNSLNYIIYYK